MTRHTIFLTGAAMTLAGLVTSPAWAQSNTTGPSRDSLLQQIEELQAREKAATARIDSLEQRLRELEAANLPANAVSVGDLRQSAMRGRGAQGTGAQGTGAQPQSLPQPAQGQVSADDQSRRRAPAPTEAVETVTKTEQGFFGERLSFEAGLTYSHFDDARLNLSGFLALDAIFLGLISIDEVSADIFAADLTTRYGLTDRLQVDVNVPYLWRRSNFQSGGAGGNATGLVEQDVRDSGLGDVSAGASYRLFRETARRPDVVTHFRVKAPTGKHAFGVELVEVENSEGNLFVPEALSTGTGVWSAAAGVSVLKTLDPLVVFGSGTYFHNFEKGFSDVDEAPGDQPGRIRLGNAIQYGAGVAFALNEQSSLSLSFTQRLVERTELKRDTDEKFADIIGSQANVGILNLGATFSVSPGLSILTNVGVGMTSDAPDMTLSLRVPFSL